MKLVLIRRFVSFLEMIKKSGKRAVNMLMMESMKDVRSVTGSNMRNIMILVGKTKVEDVKLEDLNSITYFPLAEEEEWKIPMIKRLIDI